MQDDQNKVNLNKEMDWKKYNKKPEKNKEAAAPKKEKKAQKQKVVHHLVSPTLELWQSKSKKNKKNSNNNNLNSNHTKTQPVKASNAVSKNHNKNKEGSKGNKKVVKQIKKPTGQFIRKCFQLFLYATLFAVTFLGYLYIVDIERYRTMRDRGVRALNSTVHLLPAEVVTKGQQAIEFIRPTVEVAVGKFQVLVNQTSTVLNTNPVLKDHWSNINEISAIIGERLAEYMRTVYRQIPFYYENAKK